MWWPAVPGGDCRQGLRYIARVGGPIRLCLVAAHDAAAGLDSTACHPRAAVLFVVGDAAVLVDLEPRFRAGAVVWKIVMDRSVIGCSRNGFGRAVALT
jgi:hypothetical protein